MNFFPVKNRTARVVIALICLIAIFKADLTFQTYQKYNMPVFDGVMYEKKNIERFDKFEGDFSLINRYSQSYFEFFGNPVSGLFSTVISAAFPKMLANNIPILIRSFLALLAFGLLLFEVMPFEQNWRKLLVIVLAYGSFFFFDFRVGLGSYIPEIPCVLMLCSAYLSLWLYMKRKQFKYLAGALGLITIVVGSRYNFAVYSALLLLPIVVLSLITFFRTEQRFKMMKLLIALIWLILMGAYLYVHLDFFFDYYFKPVQYEKTSFYMRLLFLLKNFYAGFGWPGILSLVVIFFIGASGTDDRKATSWQKTLLAWFPFVFFFVFTVAQKRGYNIPHINTLNFVSLLLGLSLPVGQFRFLKSKKVAYLIIVFGIIAFSAQHYYYHKKLAGYRQVEEINVVPRGIVENLAKKIRSGEKVNYMTAFESILEVPVDVALFRETDVFLGTTNQFFLNDWNLWDIDTGLDVDKIALFYKNVIQSDKIHPFYIGEQLPVPYRGFATAVQVHEKLYHYILNHPNYRVSDTLKSKYHGIIYEFSLQEN